MRTTLDIDDDVLHAAKVLAAKRKTPTGRVLSELAWRGWPGRSPVPCTGSPRRCPGHPSRGEVITVERVCELMEGRASSPARPARRARADRAVRGGPRLPRAHPPVRCPQRDRAEPLCDLSWTCHVACGQADGPPAASSPFPRASGAERLPPLSHAWIARLRRLRHPRARGGRARPCRGATYDRERDPRRRDPRRYCRRSGMGAAHDELCRHWTQLARASLRVEPSPGRAPAHRDDRDRSGRLAAVPSLSGHRPGQDSGSSARRPRARPAGERSGQSRHDPAAAGRWSAGVWLVSGTVDPGTRRSSGPGRARTGIWTGHGYEMRRGSGPGRGRAGCDLAGGSPPRHRAVGGEALPRPAPCGRPRDGGAPLGPAGVPVRIPMPGGAESLNVAQATALLLYELIRTRAGRLDLPGPAPSLVAAC